MKDDTANNVSKRSSYQSPSPRSALWAGMILEYALDHDVGLLSGRHFVTVLSSVEGEKREKKRRKKEKMKENPNVEAPDRAFLAMLAEGTSRKSQREVIFPRRPSAFQKGQGAQRLFVALLTRRETGSKRQARE